jgi:hypothetical protein
MRIASIAESSLWTRFLEAFVEDMLLMAYVDAHTTKFNFRKFFLAAPIIFASRVTFEKLPTDVPTQNGSLTRDIPSVRMLVGLLLLLC